MWHLERVIYPVEFIARHYAAGMSFEAQDPFDAIALIASSPVPGTAFLCGALSVSAGGLSKPQWRELLDAAEPQCGASRFVAKRGGKMVEFRTEGGILVRRPATLDQWGGSG